MFNKYICIISIIILGLISSTNNYYIYAISSHPYVKFAIILIVFLATYVNAYTLLILIIIISLILKYYISMSDKSNQIYYDHLSKEEYKQLMIELKNNNNN
jgi:hypothetical protein